MNICSWVQFWGVWEDGSEQPWTDDGIRFWHFYEAA